MPTIDIILTDGVTDYLVKTDVNTPGGQIIRSAAAEMFVDVVANVPIGYVSDQIPNGKAGMTTGGNGRYRAPFKIGPGLHRIQPDVSGGNCQMPTNVQYEQVKPVEPVARWNGTISDNGSVAQNVADAKALGYDTMRIWFGWDAVTGKLTDPNDIAQANAYIAAGINVIAQLTPQMDAATVAYPTAARDAIIRAVADGGLDRRALVFLINESNLVTIDDKGKKHWYWPNGDRNSAFVMASKLSGEFQAAGFKTGSPSFTYQTASSITEWWKEAIAKGWTNFDYIDGHNYPTVGTHVPNAVENFESVCKTYRDIADQLGKKCAMSEWGMYGDKTKFAEALPQLDAIVKKYTHVSAYFIMRYIEKHAKYGLHLIDANGKVNALGASAAKANGKAVAVPAAGK